MTILAQGRCADVPRLVNRRTDGTTAQAAQPPRSGKVMCGRWSCGQERMAPFLTSCTILLARTPGVMASAE